MKDPDQACCTTRIAPAFVYDPCASYNPISRGRISGTNDAYDKP